MPYVRPLTMIVSAVCIVFRTSSHARWITCSAIASSDLMHLIAEMSWTRCAVWFSFVMIETFVMLPARHFLPILLREREAGRGDLIAKTRHVGYYLQTPVRESRKQAGKFEMDTRDKV